MTELTKTIGFGIGARSGAEMLHGTMTSHEGADLAAAIGQDFAQILNEAGLPPGNMRQSLQLSRMAGYVTELASLVGGLSALLGFRFES